MVVIDVVVFELTVMDCLELHTGIVQTYCELLWFDKLTCKSNPPNDDMIQKPFAVFSFGGVAGMRTATQCARNRVPGTDLLSLGTDCVGVLRFASLALAEWATLDARPKIQMDTELDSCVMHLTFKTAKGM
eukprot:1067385-Amphidinium_carterae.1